MFVIWVLLGSVLSQVKADSFVTHSELELLTHHLEVLQEQLQNTQKQLENTDQKYQNTHELLQNTQKQLENTDQKYQNTHELLQNTLKHQENIHKQLQNAQHEIDATRKEMKITNLAMQNCSRKVLELQTWQEDLEDKLGDTSQRGTPCDLVTSNKTASSTGIIAFSAHRTDGVYGGSSATEPILFDLVDFNIGSGYDSASSIFTAPVGGLYFFAVSVRDNNANMDAYLMINTNIWRYLDSDDELDTTSASGVAQLQAGDTVSVDLKSNHFMHCMFNGCHFDGYLLHQQLE